MKKNDVIKVTLDLHPLIKGAIGDAMKKALQSRPVKMHIHNGIETTVNFYEIDGEIYSEECAIEKILGEYSWWKE